MSRVIVYPIKGCAGVPLDEAHVLREGIRHDRRFMVVDDRGNMLSQRQVPRLALLTTAFASDHQHVVVSAPDHTTVRVPIPGVDGEPCQVRMFGNTLDARDLGSDWADWFSSALGRTARLVGALPEDSWQAGVDRRGARLFADSSSVTVLSTSSLEDLNSRLRAVGHRTLGMDRFRPNIVVDGCKTPHWEDEQTAIDIGSVRLAFAGRTGRCMVTMVDQTQGRRDGPEPIRTLARYRKADGGVQFASGYDVYVPGVLRVGDRLCPAPGPYGSSVASPADSASLELSS